ncbi:Hypothetical predicted protein [Octopus vulgaris]|uniref:ISXO2-like transposase domain-containing protein n=1 Tax=Octopus vulgaris TaxID=6645 RepID=A0AA36EZC5_OCTVU|nr:Hypothetical predicted protein [Octopus vulgaris]
MSEVGIGPEAIVNWNNYFRDVCAMWCFDHPVQLGEDVVEINESKFMHRKYRGSYRESHLVFGMVERESLRCVLVSVEHRSAATLLPIITRHVLPGTKIVTDSWRAYNSLPNYFTVNHSVTFVDPNDASIHTNTVERMWSNVKSNYRRMHGTNYIYVKKNNVVLSVTKSWTVMCKFSLEKQSFICQWQSTTSESSNTYQLSKNSVGQG